MEKILGYEWSTHQPIIKAVLSVFSPKFVLELGSGIFSTPILISSNAEEVLCIENDGDWYAELQSKLEFSGKRSIRHHILPNYIDKGTSFYSLNTPDRSEIFLYYNDLYEEILKKKTPRFLFVDQYTCLRTLSINMLYDAFDIIAYHDCQPLGVVHYDYRFEEDLIKNYIHFTFKTATSWTGAFIRREVFKDNFKRVLNDFVKDYRKEHKLSEEDCLITREL